MVCEDLLARTGRCKVSDLWDASRLNQLTVGLFLSLPIYRFPIFLCHLFNITHHPNLTSPAQSSTRYLLLLLLLRDSLSRLSFTNNTKNVDDYESEDHIWGTDGL